MSTLEIDIFRDVHALASKRAGLTDTFAGLSRIIRKNFAVDHCSIYLLDKTTGELVLEYSSAGADAVHHRLPVGVTLRARCQV